MASDTEVIIQAGKRLDESILDLPPLPQQEHLLEIAEQISQELQNRELKKTLGQALNTLSAYHLTLSDFARAIHSGAINATYCRTMARKAMQDHSDFQQLHHAMNDLETFQEDISFSSINDELKRTLFEKFYPAKHLVEIQQPETDNDEKDFLLLSILGFLKSDSKFYRLTPLGKKFIETNKDQHFKTRDRFKRWLTMRSVSGGRTLIGWIGSGIIGFMITIMFGG